ncbi:MAG TPA: transposase [Candidatus Nanoarchaeia archaeon]|nr:transposase [Candidatus Nanoarchaeia archaeon]
MTEELISRFPGGIFPKCPECNEGYLLPFSYKEDVFEKWKCSKCGHTIQKR